MQQLQAAHDEYDEEATLFLFHLQSLKQGQPRSLLTQAARHHAAQMYFFKKALKSLEAVELHVKLVTEQQHIDYNFTSLEDEVDNSFDDGDDDEEDDMHDDGESSFDHRQDDLEQDVATSTNSMEIDVVDVTFPHISPLGAAKESIAGSYRKSFSFRGELGRGSQSAPLFAENKSNQMDKLKQMQPTYMRKFNSYVSPTPVNTKSSNTTASGSLVPRTIKTNLSGQTQNLWHSSPLDPTKYDKFNGDEKISGPTAANVNSVLWEGNDNMVSSQLPLLADGLSLSCPDPMASSKFKKIKRYAFSGPITMKPLPSKPAFVEQLQLFSGPLLQNPTGQLPSPKVSPKASPKESPGASPTFVSSPKISELHELPRPPANSASKSSRPLSFVGHSVPLFPRSHVLPATSKSLVLNAATPLPMPSQVITRSFFIPSSGLRVMALNVSKLMESTNNAEMSENGASPHLIPILLSNA